MLSFALTVGLWTCSLKHGKTTLNNSRELRCLFPLVFIHSAVSAPMEPRFLRHFDSFENLCKLVQFSLALLLFQFLGYLNLFSYYFPIQFSFIIYL
jgi:hypothetical protein